MRAYWQVKQVLRFGSGSGRLGDVEADLDIGAWDADKAARGGEDVGLARCRRLGGSVHVNFNDEFGAFDADGGIHTILLSCWDIGGIRIDHLRPSTEGSAHSSGTLETLDLLLNRVLGRRVV